MIKLTRDAIIASPPPRRKGKFYLDAQFSKAKYYDAIVPTIQSDIDKCGKCFLIEVYEEKNPDQHCEGRQLLDTDSDLRQEERNVLAGVDRTGDTDADNGDNR